MARKGALRDPDTGRLMEGGQHNIFYDALHETGAFDPQLSDPDFLAGRKPLARPRTVTPITMWPETVAGLARLSRAMEMSRGRVVDRLVELAIAQLDKHEAEHEGHEEGQ